MKKISICILTTIISMNAYAYRYHCVVDENERDTSQDVYDVRIDSMSAQAVYHNPITGQDITITQNNIDSEYSSETFLKFTNNKREIIGILAEKKLASGESHGDLFITWDYYTHSKILYHCSKKGLFGF